MRAKPQRQRTGKGSTQQAGRTNGGKGGEGGGRRKRTGTQPWQAEKQQRKAEQAAKQKHSSETIKAGRQREGTNTFLRMTHGEREGIGTMSRHRFEVLQYPILHRKARSNSMHATKLTDGTQVSETVPVHSADRVSTLKWNI